jgi:hypothetical protein
VFVANLPHDFIEQIEFNVGERANVFAFHRAMNSCDPECVVAGCLLASMPIMAKAEAANKKQMKLLTTFSLRLVAVPRVRLRDVFDMERRALDTAT